MKKHTWLLLANIPTFLWMITLVLLSLVHRQVPQAGWLLLHVLFLGAASSAVMVWSAHFMDALLRLPPDALNRRGLTARLALINLGAVAAVVGVWISAMSLVAAGAVLVMTAAGWHGVAIWRVVRRSLPSGYEFVAHYYIGAAAFLVVGAGLGGVLAHSSNAELAARMVVAHTIVNLLGWIGLAVAGTIVTLLPTVMRMRLPESTVRNAQMAMRWLFGTIVVAWFGALIQSQLLLVVGLIGYIAAWTWLQYPFIRRIALEGVPQVDTPNRFASWSLMAGCAWFVVTIAAWAVQLAIAPSWFQAAAWTGRVAVPFATGFLVQVLLGSLAFLLPVILGGGPRHVRQAIHAMEWGATFRVGLANAGLVAFMLPTPSLVKVAGSTLALGAFASFLPLVAKAIYGRFRTDGDDAPAVPPRKLRVKDSALRQRSSALASAGVAAGISIVMLAVVAAVAVDPAAAGRATPASAHSGHHVQVAPTGQTTTIEMSAADMTFTPGRIEVPAGNRLVVMLVNRDTMVHDLVFANGASTGRISPGQSGTVDVGVISSDLAGWCSVVGHRQMGMTVDVVAVGVPAADDTAMAGMDHDGESGADATIDFMRKPSEGFVAHDPRLAPVSSQRVHKETLRVKEVAREVAPGVTQRLWTFNGSMPGPVLRGKVGDTFDITLINDGSMGHSIDFHAGSLAPDKPMRTISPGESLQYRFTATRSGIWMYHCSTMPMSAHIANGMFGAVVIDPPNLAPVDQEYLMIQSELYLGAQGGMVDEAKLNGERPDAVVFNGYANQYDYRPIDVSVGKRIRIWVLVAGPNRPTSFHVVGGQFDQTYAEGRLLLDGHSSGGAQALALAPAQGGYVELTLPEAGNYPFVSHIMFDAEHGAHGIFHAS